MYSLDSNVAIDVFRRPHGRLRARLIEAQSRGLLGVSSVVLFELHFGVLRGTSPNGHERLARFLSGVSDVYAFDAEDAVSAGELRQDLEKQGRKIGPYDTLIAAQALRRGLTLVTANIREFERIPGLRLENWRE
jgi:tRNA(fMet)-specific endonuclease VapC